LNVITVTLPELNERVSDIPLLVNHFTERYNAGSKAKSVSPAAMDILTKYSWPGNVRELVNAIEYATVMAKGIQIMPSDLPESVQGRPTELQLAREPLSLKETERELIVRTLKECHGNKHLTAKILRIPRSTLYSKLQKHGITITLDENENVLSCHNDDRDEENQSLPIQNWAQQAY
jgi:DNA-binding NtrC family response regulator